ncbi:MAG TPA: hypothetical protein VFB81_20505, partial [Myxococcales bacterium]|nr:hypothetical protein [Myxococcales bacterium]
FEPLARMGLTEQNAAAAVDFVKALGRGDLGTMLQDAQRLGGGAVVNGLQDVLARAGVSPESVKAVVELVQGQDAKAVVDFAGNIARGDVGQALMGLGNEAARIAGSPELQRAMGYVQDGAAVVGALQQGRFSGAMERLGVPAREVAAVRQAEELVKALQAGDLNALAQTGPAQQLLQSAQSLAQQLGDGQALDAFARFTGALEQLQAAAAVPGFDQEMMAKANQLLALAAGGELLRAG